MIVVIDYDIGNVGSVANMIKKIGFTSVVTGDPDIIAKANKLILCGIGAYDNAMQSLIDKNLVDILNERVLIKKIPILGICVGMQLFTESGEEGVLKGLGWIKGETKKFNFSYSNHPLPIPHMGWNYVNLVKKSPLWKDMYDQAKFYFVHSYHVVTPEDSQDGLLTTSYGYPFISAVEKDNIIGVQFHPEKSHKYGMRLFKNFIENY